MNGEPTVELPHLYPRLTKASILIGRERLLANGTKAKLNVGENSDRL